MEEVQRRHEQDCDRAVDELMNSQNEIERLEKALPEMGNRHRFYQDLRGYVTDLVECFDEKVNHNSHFFTIMKYSCHFSLSDGQY